MRLFMLSCLAACFCVTAQNLQAQNMQAQNHTQTQTAGRERLGIGRIFSNDYFGDNQDRWRTGSYAVSVVRGYSWDGVLPRGVGDIIEYRLRSDIIAPQNIVRAAPGDRRYVGALSFGVHTHFQRAQQEFSLGADLVVTGPQNGLGQLQTSIHEALGAPVPGVLGNQIPNGFHPNLTFETGRRFEFGTGVAFRPFVEVLAGVETMARVGGDLHFGQLGRDEIWLRDVATGNLYRANRGEHTGFAALIGADVAYVTDSIYLPSSGGYQLTDARTRLRAGVHWQGETSSVFYGLTYLGEEFKAQPEGQVLGSLRLDIRF